MENFTPLLSTTDWNDEWKRLQKARRHADNASYWDERAKTFGKKDSPNPYVTRFLELAGIRPGETVFDMGAGTGALSVPLGAAGHRVIAGDFSEGMLAILRGTLAERGIACVETRQFSWEDDWNAHGIGPKSVDVAVASRSIAVADLERALRCLDAVARRRVCLTLPTGSSPRTDERVLRAVGLHNEVGRDHLYAFNILAALDIKAEVSYITSERAETFDSPEEAHEKYEQMIRRAAEFRPPAEVEAAVEKLRPWVDAQLVPNEHVGRTDRDGRPEGRLRALSPRRVTWAFIAWNTDEE